MAPVFSLVLDQDVSEEIALLYPELYKDLTKVNKRQVVISESNNNNLTFASVSRVDRFLSGLSSLGSWSAYIKVCMECVKGSKCGYQDWLFSNFRRCHHGFINSSIRGWIHSYRIDILHCPHLQWTFNGRLGNQHMVSTSRASLLVDCKSHFAPRHRIMVISEVATILIYIASMWLLPTYFGMLFSTLCSRNW